MKAPMLGRFIFWIVVACGEMIGSHEPRHNSSDSNCTVEQMVVTSLWTDD